MMTIKKHHQTQKNKEKVKIKSKKKFIQKSKRIKRPKHENYSVFSFSHADNRNLT